MINYYHVIAFALRIALQVETNTNNTYKEISISRDTLLPSL